MKSKGVLITFSIVLGYMCLLAKACIWSARTMDFVQSCPSTKEDTDKRSKIRRCGALAQRQNCTEPNKFKYHCLLNNHHRKFVEVCAEEIYSFGVCMVFDEISRQIRHVYNVKCGNKSSSCPEIFRSSNGHLYAPCPDLVYLKYFDIIGSNNSQLPVNESQISFVLTVSIPIAVFMTVTGITILFCYRRKRCCKEGDEKERNLETHEKQTKEPFIKKSQKSMKEQKSKNKQETRGWHAEYAEKETKTVHYARGMIVGCAGAGKTTLLKRLLGCCEEEIKEVKSTEGLEVHEEIFELCEETKSLEARIERTDSTKSENYATDIAKKTLTFIDFGGQPVYFACHQIYLTRKAFYVVVVDASKRLEQEVDNEVCDQAGSVFSGWTYGDYFAFWIQSIHTLWVCGSEKEEDPKPKVLIVATHWEEGEKQFMDEFGLLYALKQRLHGSSNLSQYIRKDAFFCTDLSVPLSKDLKGCIYDIALNQRWRENIPMEWVDFEIEINHKKHKVRILDREEVTKNIPEVDIEQENHEHAMVTNIDMLQFYHDTRKILFYNEKCLQEHIILDVQWFFDALKHIISNKLTLRTLEVVQSDWDEFHNTGILQDRLLTEIWRCIDGTMYKQLKEDQRDDSEIKTDLYESDTRCLIYHKTCLFKFMKKIGLFAIGKESYYIPCMNRRHMEKEVQCFIKNAKKKSSILIYRYQYLPYFVFFRLVVACMEENWKIMKNRGTYCLYKNAVLFSNMKYFILVSVTTETIQLQVFCTVRGHILKRIKTYSIQRTIENILSDLTGTDGRKACFVRGFRCRMDKENVIAMDIKDHFLSENYFAKVDRIFRCPLHLITEQHDIYADEVTKYWKLTSRWN